MLTAVFLFIPSPCQGAVACWQGALSGVGCQKLSDGRVFRIGYIPASFYFRTSFR